ncbi:MAG: zinc ribbon domain-containing protein [Gemmatimonadetes bacterium]|nr:zinc ribbon domain-containing protein [Gemmatimonadota bacterium]
MPTYQFRCPDGTIVERIFKISEVPATIPVPNGEGEAVRMISGGAGLIFKGSGFYITDYGKDGKKDQREASKGEAAKSDSSKADTPKADAAPAKAEPTKAAPASGSSGGSE